MSDLAAQAEMLGNRLRKRARHLTRWARRSGVTCYRIYDRDIPELPLVVDRYEGHAHVASFARFTDDAWLDAMAAVVAGVLDVPRAHVHVKRHVRQRGATQYERLGHRDELLTVGEGGLRFAVNLDDYLDTGLFLDHRPTRERVRAEAAGGRFLNLFCYTGSFTVYAAAGGAAETVSVDLSRRYLDWARHNLELNGLAGPRHDLVRGDALELLEQRRWSDRFDLAVLDPPTFSNSKRMAADLDLQRDHARLIAGALDALRPGGVLYFSTNARRFKLDAGALTAASIEDLGGATIPEDFARRPPHRTWRIVR